MNTPIQTEMFPLLTILFIRVMREGSPALNGSPNRSKQA